ncbi:MAG: phosphatase PAP2 family protein [Pseudomonadota bacterium]
MDQTRLPPETLRAWWALGLVLAVLLWVMWNPGTNINAFFAINAWGAGTERFWAGITLLGDTAVTAVLLLPFVWRHPRVVWTAVLAGVVATMLVHDLKPALSVVRPAGVYPEGVVHVIGHALHSNSFPSGHAASYFTIAGALALALRLSLPGVLAVFALAAFGAISRSVVGAHWPQDILAGALIGWLAAGMGWRLSRCFPVNRRWGQPLLALILVGGLVALVNFDGGYPEGRWVLILVALWAVFGSAWAMLSGGSKNRNERV